MLFSTYKLKLNLHISRYHVKYLWTKCDTHMVMIAQLKLIILKHVNMAWIMYILTCEYSVIYLFDEYLCLCIYFV